MTALAKCLEYKCKNIQWLQLWFQRDFKVLGSGPEQNGYEMGVKNKQTSYSAPCKIDDLLDVSEVNKDFRISFFF